MSQIKVKQSKEDAMAQPVEVNIIPCADDIVFWLEGLDDETFKRVLKSSRLRRKGNKALKGDKDGE